MYGTVARTRVRPENRAKLQEIFEGSTSRDVPGYIAAYTLHENYSDTSWLVAVFQDKASYEKNADDPAQHLEYEAYRALMEDEPEWHDGEIQGM